jgi:hypothetical protein
MPYFRYPQSLSIGTMPSSLAVDFPNRRQHKYEPHLHANITQKHRSVRFSLSSSLYYSSDVTQDEVVGSWYSSEEEQRFKRIARQEVRSFRKVIVEDGFHVSVRSKSGRSHVGLERSLASRAHREKRVMTRRMVLRAVLDEQSRSVPHDDNHEKIAIASRQHSEWSRAQAQTIGYFQALSR